MALSSVEDSAVKVIVRLRPMNEMEKSIGVTPAVSASSENNTVTVLKGQGLTKAVYSFDNVFSGFATQEEVFQESLAHIINDCIKGYTSTILAYGQTGTGKTHTMEGDLSSPFTYGVIPRSMDVIFRALKKKNIVSSRVTCSYLEIYNEDLSDLLAYDNSKKLDILNGRDGTCCRGLVEKEVKNRDDVIELVHHAVRSRKIGETKMNKKSSRSHCIFTVHVYSQSKSLDNSIVDYHGKLNLVDLAGSENAKNASGDESRKSVDGNARERERKNINQSLLTLGRVISAVKDRSLGEKVIRVPYRDSKLTRILQDALGGRSKTAIIATVSPSEMAVSESLSTLTYAQAASSIINKPITSSHHVSKMVSEGALSNGNHSVDQWFELESKLKHMEAQVEEAQAMLSRKHQQQQLLVDKADKAKAELEKMEDSLLKTQAKNTELEGLVERQNSAMDILATSLKQSEDSLIRTNAILKATKHTENNLTSEGQLLIHAVKESIQDGDDLHRLLIETKEDEIDRKEASKTFQHTTIASLGEVTSAIDIILKEEEEFCKSLTDDAEQYSATERQSLERIVTTLKEIHSNVKALSQKVKIFSVGEGGIALTVDSTVDIVHSELSKERETIVSGKDSLNLSTQETKQKLDDLSMKIMKFNSRNAEDSNCILDSLISKIDVTKQQIVDVASAIVESTLEISSTGAKIRKDLRTTLDDLEEKSLKSIKDIGSRSLHQHSKLQNSITDFSKGMENFENVRSDLVSQKSYIGTKIGTQQNDLSSQASMLSIQRAAFAEVHEQQRQMQDEIMSNVVDSVQKLLASEFYKLSTENETRFNAFEKDTVTMAELNKRVESSTNLLAEDIEKTNESILSHIGALSRNDESMLESSNEVSNALFEIKSIAKKQHYMMGDIGKEVHEKMDALTLLDEPLQNSMITFQDSKDKIVEQLSDDVSVYAKEGIKAMIDTGTETTKFLTDNMITGVVSDLDQTAIECGTIFNDISNSIDNIQNTVRKTQDTIQVTVKKQCHAIDELQHSVILKCSDFHKVVILPRNEEIKKHSTTTMSRANARITAASESITSIRDVSNEVSAQFGIFCEDVININDPSESVSKRKEIKYITDLSSTPADEEIIANFDENKMDTQNENRKPSKVLKIDSRDEDPAEIDTRSAISPLSLISRDTRASVADEYRF